MQNAAQGIDECATTHAHCIQMRIYTIKVPCGPDIQNYMHLQNGDGNDHSLQPASRAQSFTLSTANNLE